MPVLGNGSLPSFATWILHSLTILVDGFALWGNLNIALSQEFLRSKAPTVDMFNWLPLVFLFTVLSHAQSQFQRGQKWQIILTGVPDTSKMPLPPTDAPVWDIDLFDSDAVTIQALKGSGKVVICYFSAGTVEDWRADARDFPTGDTGKVLPEWPNEKWIRTGSTKVRDIMAKRIKLAGDKGCDAIDPDNIGMSSTKPHKYGAPPKHRGEVVANHSNRWLREYACAMRFHTS